MNKILDLEELLYENKRRERNKLEIFEHILKNCHTQINRYNKEHKVKNCHFSVPIMIAGKPPYNFNVLVNYLLYHLKDNGLFARFLPATNQIYISWDESHLNLKRYEHRKERINKDKYASAYAAREEKRNTYSINLGKARKKTKKNVVDMLGGAGNVFTADYGPVNKNKYERAQRRRQIREQEFREGVQNQPVQRKSFSDFLKSF